MFYPEPPAQLPDYIDGSRSGRGAAAPIAGAIKRAISIPVISVGRFDPELGEQTLRAGKADFISMNRRLMADPQLPNKVAKGRTEDIAPCTACLTCFEMNLQGIPISCRINAALSKEREYEIKPASKKKKVVVVGGGPAGMETARVAALRGHEVILYEKESKLGGSLPLAAMIKGQEREELMGIVQYLQTQLTKLSVKTVLGQEATRESIKSLKPDVLVIAAGGLHNIPDIPGIKRKNVMTSEQLHHRLKKYLKFFGPDMLKKLTTLYLPVGKRVVVMGGGIHGCQTAEFLVKRGRKVTIVDSSKNIGEGLVTYLLKPLLLDWLKSNGVTMMAGVTYKEITDKGLVITVKKKPQSIEADTIVTALPLKPNTELLKSLKDGVPKVYAIGDAKEPNLIIDAIADGSRIGHAI
jgi:2,4-dienoyl-CoA reductase (NADPH2)